MDIKKLLKNLKNENKEIECKRCKNSYLKIFGQHIVHLPIPMVVLYY